MIPLDITWCHVKEGKDSLDTWDIYLKQELAAIRFIINESTKFSPFYLLYNHDPSVTHWLYLKSKEKVLEEESHTIGLEKQHKSFVIVHQHLKKAKRRGARYAKNSQYTKFEEGDTVYFKQQQCKSKLQGRWFPYNRIIEKRTPVTFCLKNQSDSIISKKHAEYLQCN